MSKNRGRRKKTKGVVRRTGPPLATFSNNRAPESSHPDPQQPLTPGPTAHAPPQAGPSRAGPSQAGPTQGLPLTHFPLFPEDHPLLADFQRRAGLLPARPSGADPSQAGPSRGPPLLSDVLGAAIRADPAQAGLSQTGLSQAGPSLAGPSQLDFLHEIETSKPLDMMTREYRPLDHTNGSGVNVERETSEEHLARDTSPLNSDDVAQIRSMFIDWLKSDSGKGAVASTFIDSLLKTTARSLTGPGVRPSSPSQVNVPELDLPEPSVPPVPPSGKSFENATNESGAPFLTQSGQNPQDPSGPESSPPYSPSQLVILEQDLPEPQEEQVLEGTLPAAPPSRDGFETTTQEAHPPSPTGFGHSQGLIIPNSLPPFNLSHFDIPEEDLPESHADQVIEETSVPASPPSGESFETATQEVNPPIPTIYEQNSQALSVLESERSEDGSPERDDPESQEDTATVRVSIGKLVFMLPEPCYADLSDSKSSSGSSSSSEDDASNPSTNRSSPPPSRGKGKLLKDIFPAMTSPYLVAPDHDPTYRGMTWRMFRKSVAVLQASLFTNTVAAFDFRSHHVLHYEEMETLARALDLLDADANLEARLFPFLRDLFALRPSCVRVPPRRFYHGRTPDRGAEFYASLRWTYWRRLMRRAPSDANQLRARELAEIPVTVLMKLMEAFFEARMNHHKKGRDRPTAVNGTEQQRSIRLLRLSNFQVIPETMLDESSQKQGAAVAAGDSSKCTESALGEAIDGWFRDMVLADGGETETTNPTWQAFWVEKFGLEETAEEKSERMQQRLDQQFEWRISESSREG